MQPTNHDPTYRAHGSLRRRCDRLDPSDVLLRCPPLESAAGWLRYARSNVLLKATLVPVRGIHARGKSLSRSGATSDWPFMGVSRLVHPLGISPLIQRTPQDCARWDPSPPTRYKPGMKLLSSVRVSAAAWCPPRQGDTAKAWRPNGSLEPTGRPTTAARSGLRAGCPVTQYRR